MKRFLSTHAPAAVLIIRIMVGAVFVLEGTQKFLFPAEVGAERFAKIGFPSPAVVAPFVGSCEIACGVLVLIGLFTRFAAKPLTIIMLTAIGTTEIPILLDQGFWKMAHEPRTDWSMLLRTVFLLIVGGGRWSLVGMWLGKSN
jgi:uncharacterized membrane protein YphA (DoxX/SURF4 family)